ncbi:MAG TPA: hypothetical protein PLQ76_01555 [bacterium]|nr:hypothetical protein [bacterium]
MKFTMVHKFGWPVEKVTDILKAGEDLFPMENLPNVNMRKLVEKKRAGSKIIKKFEWCVHGQIPKIAQKIFSPESLTFIEDSVWDDDKCAFESRITPHLFKSVVTCETTSAWRSSPDGGAERRVDSTITIAIPIIGPVAEKAISDHFRKNNDQSAELVRKGLTAKYGPPA